MVKLNNRRFFYQKKPKALIKLTAPLNDQNTKTTEVKKKNSRSSLKSGRFLGGGASLIITQRLHVCITIIEHHHL